MCDHYYLDARASSKFIVQWQASGTQILQTLEHLTSENLYCVNLVTTWIIPGLFPLECSVSYVLMHRISPMRLLTAHSPGYSKAFSRFVLVPPREFLSSVSVEFRMYLQQALRSHMIRIECFDMFVEHIVTQVKNWMLIVYKCKLLKERIQTK